MAFKRRVSPADRLMVAVERRLNSAVDELVYAVLGGPTPAAKALGVTPASVHETIARGHLRRRDAAIRWAAVAAKNGHPVPAGELLGVVPWQPELRTRGGMIRPAERGRLPLHMVTPPPSPYTAIYEEPMDPFEPVPVARRRFGPSVTSVDVDGAPLRPTSPGGGMERLVYARPEERVLPGPGAATLRQMLRGTPKKKVKAKKRGKGRGRKLGAARRPRRHAKAIGTQRIGSSRFCYHEAIQQVVSHVPSECSRTLALAA
jgi:hypothetical protein